MRTSSVLSISVLLAAAGAPALAHEGDIALAVINNRLTTGIVGIDTGGAEYVDANGQRVFLGELDSAGFAADPGFFSGPLGSITGAVTVPAGASLDFTIRGPLQQWTGAGFASTASRMRLDFGGFSRLTPAAPGTVAGFGLPTGTGAFDQHWDFFAVNSTDTGVAADGIYLLEVELFLSGTTVQPALPIWLVFNLNSDEAQHEAAEEWVELNLVPAPGAAAALAGLALLGARRRRR
jgi:hypothetical protein